MRFIKRCICLLLMITVLIPRVTCYAYGEQQPRSEYYLTVTIVSDSHGVSSSVTDYLGHAFLIVRNDSTFPVTVGHMQIPAESAITIGTFGNIDAHKGIWYNVEGYRQSYYDGTAATYSVPQSDLSALNYAINSHDRHSDITDNCAAFARDVWNAVVPSSYEVSGGIPATLEASIALLNIATTSYTIPVKSNNQVAYQTEDSVQPYELR